MFAENLPSSEYSEDDKKFEKQAVDYQLQFHKILHKYQHLIVKDSMVIILYFNISMSNFYNKILSSIL